MEGRCTDAHGCSPQMKNRRALGLGGSVRSGRRLDRRPDRAQDRADLGAQENQGNDRDDRDEGEDQRVLRETLALLVAPERGEEAVEERHAAASWMSSTLG